MLDVLLQPRIRLGLVQGQTNSESRSEVPLRAYTDVAAHTIHNLLADAEAKAVS